MKSSNIIELPFAILDILDKQSDEEHIISMPDLLIELEDYGFSCDRRAAYRAINTLNKYGIQIEYKQIHRKQGYYLKRNLSEAELTIIISSLYNISSLSIKDTKKIEDKINTMYSPFQKKNLYKPTTSNSKTDNIYVIDNIDLILNAIKHNDDIEFRYYDLTISKEKKYRKDKKKYQLTPYAITSTQGRFYAVMYNETYKTFNTYRIDKMDTLSIINKDNVKVSFNLDNYLRNSFQMYSGEASTVSIKCPLDFATILFDEFAKDIIISKVTSEYFIANIRTSITPTLTSWLLQFYNKIEVIKPKELIDELKKIAKHINKTY